jgi:hypothetical protein
LGRASSCTRTEGVRKKGWWPGVVSPERLESTARPSYGLLSTDTGDRRSEERGGEVSVSVGAGTRWAEGGGRREEGGGGRRGREVERENREPRRQARDREVDQQTTQERRKNKRQDKMRLRAGSHTVWPSTSDRTDAVADGVGRGDSMGRARHRTRCGRLGGGWMERWPFPGTVDDFSGRCFEPGRWLAQL